MNRAIRLLAAGMALSCLSGCASLQHDRLRQDMAGLPAQAEVRNVPFHAQEKYQCGPAALAMVFAHEGVLATPGELSGEVFIPQREGSLQIEMLAAPRRYGLVSLPLKPRLADLLAEVAAGEPVVVLQNLAYAWYPRWHYSLVMGFDLDRDKIILRSGTAHRQEISVRTFEHTWRRSGYWAMLVLPPDRLPQTVGEEDYVAAVVRLEAEGKPAATGRGYETALQRWPHNLQAQIGLGNAAYAARNLGAAINAYRRATLSHPDSAIAFNNLGQALADAGHLPEALEAARKAVSLAGSHADFAQRTLAEITAKAAAQ